MALINKNFSIRPGATKALRFKWYSVDSTTRVKTPIDLTNYTGIMQIREEEDSAAVLLEISTDNARLSLSNVGDIVALLSATVTSNYNTRKAVYDLLLTDTDTGVVTEFASGIVTKDTGVTR